MLSGKIYGRYTLSYLHVWQFHECNTESVTYCPKNRTRLSNGFIYIREGNPTIQELDSGVVLTANPGDLLLLPMDVAYSITWKPGVRTHDLVNFLFDYNCCIPYHSERGLMTWDTIQMSRKDALPPFLPSGKITLIPGGNANDHLLAIYNDLHNAFNSTDDYTAFTINAKFYRLIDYVHKVLYPSGETNCGREIDRARMYIETNCTEPLSIAALAEQFSMNRSYFSRRFKEIVGVPPIEYKNKIRMKLAQDLLVNTNYTVREISELLGFSSDVHFRDRFVHEFGLPPLQYRKKHRAASGV